MNHPDSQLVLSLFPGVGLLDLAFQEAGFCVVRGPDLIHGADCRDWRLPPACRIDGIIAGPPCQGFSVANTQRSNPDHESVQMSREMLVWTLRVIEQSNPLWAIIENVPTVPDVTLAEYNVQRIAINDWECGGTQLRWRAIQYLDRRGYVLRPHRVNDRSNARRKGRRPVAITTKPISRHQTFADQCRRQGMACALELSGWTKSAKFKAVGNGVPLSIGRVFAAAVQRAGPNTKSDCVCGCGRTVTPPARSAGVACRKRLQVSRERSAGLRPCTVATVEGCFDRGK